ncbi:MAG: energy-dependent translational throttle protein EttA, partial [Kiritimatiellia bacterium]
MAGEYVFNLQRVTKIYNKTPVLENVTLAFFYGAKIGVIGGNGSGKSTLLRIMAGLDQDFMGEAILERKLQVGYLPQEPQLTPGRTVAEAVEEGVTESRRMLERYDRICEELGGQLSAAETERLGTEMGDLQEQIDALDLWELDRHVEVAMDALRLPPGDTPADTLSGGEKRRVALCRLLISNPDILLLDEPTNHLDAESVAWLETYLKQFKGTVVVVTHDRYFLNDVTEWILELDGGQAYPFKGNYTAWLEQKQQMLQRDQKQQQSRRKLLEQELAWVRLNPSGRRSRNKARLSRYEELAQQTVDTQPDSLEIQIPPGPRLGDLVVRAENLTKSFDDRVIMQDVCFDLPRGGIVGVIGGNGAGKTTLFKMIIGQEQPTAGNLTIGASVNVAYVDQTRDALDPDKTVFEEITDGQDTVDLGGRPMNSRAY